MTAAPASGRSPEVGRADIRLARQFGGVVAVATFLVLVGWYAGVEQLTTLVPGFASMKPNTALCLLLLALVPWFHPSHGRVTTFLAATVLAIASITAVELALTAHWWIDRVLPGIDLRGNDPQMAPVTACCLILLSVSAIAGSFGGQRLRQGPALLAIAAADVALVGYLYGASTLYGVGAYSSIAIPTAISIALLGATLLVLVPEGPAMTLLRDRGPAGKMVRSLAPFLLIGPPALGFLRLLGQRRGWYDTTFGVAILVSVLTVVSLLLLFRTARQVRVAALARDEAAAELEALNEGLEDRVREQTSEAHRLAAQFEATFTASPIGGAFTTPDGVVRLANDELVALVRRTRVELVGNDVQDMFDDEHAARDLALREALLDGAEGGYPMERRLRTADNDVRWVLVHVAVVKEADQISGLLYKLQDVTRRKAAEDRANFLAFHDSLTTLPNRTLLMDRLQQALHQGARSGRGVGLLFLDLDRFKTVNDSLGHDAGDEVLREVGRRLQAAARAGDTVARIGGDEFIVVCPNISSEDDVIPVATKLHEILARPWSYQGHDVPLGGSIGIAYGVAHDDPELLMRKADQAMYRAKAGGRSRYEVFDDDLRAHLDARLETELGLRGAVEREEIETWFQPVVDLANGRCVATEALVRWRRPGHGLVMPGDFIGVAEEDDLIKEIGGHVLTSACRAVAPLPDLLCVSVNVSARQFVHGDFQAEVAAALLASGLDPSRLWLELTEGAVIEAVDSAARSFQSLRATGVKLAIDDFGTGYSSFIQLRHFEVDIVKIDKTFTAGLAHSARDRELVGTMISMGHSLGLQVVGEGVETIAQRDILLDLGCDLGQGYLFSMASPAVAPLLSPLP
ncbi:bifunctional diguanylate cyclase/phosphodiesterase [Nocardioides sp. WS12]|uniref:putative bifunctional diguanylate cyclase/phosphodiesterase n=1 Tax=Nocardioides sp. WS12 TaxID=2486272 RepID=UPI0015FA0B14|nr:bifunctional diguanylate cyclase/phosphodiesterase [Nocardioides sp. WS12]